MIRFLSNTVAAVLIMAMLADLITRGMFGTRIED